MKTIIFFILTISVANISAKKKLSYAISNDVQDKNVSRDKTLIHGKVVDRNGYQIQGANIVTLSGKYSTLTDKEGNYSFKISSEDSVIYMFSSGYEEVVISPYNFKGGHKVQIDFTPFVQVEMIEVEKPVIYCYTEEETQVNIKLNPKSTLTFTYPEYKDGWQFTTDATGELKFENKFYPYLFWEGTRKEQKYLTENGVIFGAFIRTDSSVQFLESQLTAMGLNEKEQTDFITYWAPRLVKKKYALIQFLTGEDYNEQVAELNVIPELDNTQRVFMLFSGTDVPTIIDGVNIVSQSFQNVKRQGFTLIEWGGAEVPLPVLEF